MAKKAPVTSVTRQASTAPPAPPDEKPDVERPEDADASFAEALAAAREGVDEEEEDLGVELPPGTQAVNGTAMTEVDGVLLDPVMAAALGLKTPTHNHQENPRPVTLKSFKVWANGKLLGNVKHATDEPDAIGQIVKVYKIAKPEQFQFKALPS